MGLVTDRVENIANRGRKVIDVYTTSIQREGYSKSITAEDVKNQNTPIISEPLGKLNPTIEKMRINL